MGNRQMIKLFLALILSTAYILGFSHFGAAAFNKLVKDQDVMEPGTTAGGLDVSGRTKPEVKEMLKEEVAAWKQETSIYFTYKEIERESKDLKVHFLVDETVSSMKSGSKNPVKISVDNESLKEEVFDTSISLSSEAVQWDKLTADIQGSAAMLHPDTYRFHLENYLEGAGDEEQVLSKAVIPTGKYSDEVDQLIQLLQPVELAGKARFSLLEKVKDLKGSKFSSTALSMVAAGIYETILPTNFEVLERNTGTKLPGYAELGKEAKINRKKNMDLVFSNGNTDSYYLEFSQSSKALTVTLKGKSFLNTYKIIKKSERHYPPKTVKQYSAQIAIGAVKVTEEGKEGIAIKIIREVYGEDGSLKDTEEISDDFYPPVYRVEVHSLTIPKVSEPEEGDGGDEQTADENTEPDSEEGAPEEGAEDSSANDQDSGDSGTSSEDDGDEQADGEDDSGITKRKASSDSDKSSSDDEIWKVPGEPVK